jgi:hypothetical protein
VYVTTETQGLWISNNINATTPSFSLVGSYPFRQPERVFFNPFNANEVWVSSFGNGMKMGTLTSTGVPEFTNDGAFGVYPNPASAFVTLSLPEGAHDEIARLFDLTGREVGSWVVNEGEQTIGLDGLAEGVYVIRLGNVVKKIMITKEQ